MEADQIFAPKAKSKVASVADIKQEALHNLVNLYCSLKEVLQPKEDAIKIEKKELEAVEEQILAILDEEHAVTDEGVIKTIQYLLQYTARGKKLTVTDKKKLIEILGMETFIEVAEVSITNVRKLLTPQQIEQCATDVYKDKRRLKFAKVDTGG